MVYNPLSWRFDQVPVPWTWEWDFVVVEPSWTIDENLIPESVPNYEDYEPVVVTWNSATISGKEFVVKYSPSSNFTINIWDTLMEWATYALRVNPDSSYIITLWSWVTNPFNENLALTANKITMIIFLAIDNTLEIQSVRTFA